jgi:hypothetical protein
MPTGDLLGLASPIAFGSRDFLGEVGSRRLSYWWVTAWLSKPGNGVSHPTHRERFEIPGMTMLGRRGIASSLPLAMTHQEEVVGGINLCASTATARSPR